jgi:hypothetical protein
MPNEQGIEGNVEDADLSATEYRILNRIAGIMIPPDAEHRVPAANDPVIFADIVRSIGRDMADMKAVLAVLAEAQFLDLDDAAAEACALTLLNTPSPLVGALSRCVLQCYYRDDRVLVALGHEAHAPFPKGNFVPQGDWTLLEPVKARGPFWRDDRRI